MCVCAVAENGANLGLGSFALRGIERAKTDTVHDWLLLSTIPIAINEIVNQLLRALVLVDESVSEVSTCT